MKTRIGFVSNSSSSSFVCHMCGNEVSGMDLNLSECEMTQCKKNHIFCNSHYEKDFYSLITKDVYISLLNPKNEWNQEILEEIKDMTIQEFETYKDKHRCDFDELSIYEIPTEFCPVCHPEFLDKKELRKFENHVIKKQKFYNDFFNNIQKAKKNE